jgi:hypothetical protein
LLAENPRDSTAVMKEKRGTEHQVVRSRHHADLHRKHHGAVVAEVVAEEIDRITEKYRFVYLPWHVTPEHVTP